MELTAQPAQSEPQRATMVLSTTTGVAAPLSPTYLTALASSTIVDLGNNTSSSMLSLAIFNAWKEEEEEEVRREKK
jgi:hypothetical protein